MQTIGRAARNAEAHVVLYADTITGSMERAMEETRRRRDRQIAHNEEHGIVPRSVVFRAVENIMEDVGGKRSREDLVYKGGDPNKMPVKGQARQGRRRRSCPFSRRSRPQYRSSHRRPRKTHARSR